MMGKTMGLFARKARTYTDTEVVEGLQRRDRTMEEWFYHAARRYFNDSFHAVFFDKDRKQEIFQTAFLKLWMEMDNGRISIVDGKVCRQQTSGLYAPMTCALTTFLMAFARTEFRELVRSQREECYDELYDSVSRSDTMVTAFDGEENSDEVRNRIVDECIQSLSPTCVEILTLFYYQCKTLDEIMALRKDKNASKNGLKTAKNKCMNTLRERVKERMH